MPIIIPIILGGIAAASAAHGVKKGIDAAHDFSAAKERSSQASLLSESLKETLRLQVSALSTDWKNWRTPKLIFLSVV